jgi:hypothetical protein
MTLDVTSSMKPIPRGGKATRVTCNTTRCRGVPFSVWDAQARLGMYFGYLHYVCDTCKTRTAVKVTDGDGT